MGTSSCAVPQCPTYLPMKRFFSVFFLIFTVCVSAQTKIEGIVSDDTGMPIAFANIIFVNSSEGTITNDNGRFYMESDETYDAIKVSFIGYETKEIPLGQKVNYNMEIVLTESAEQLQEVVVYTGKQSKKNNPAIDILRKIWAKKRENGVRKFKQYQYDKYEKIEFDLNTIDSALIKSKLFKGLEFMFEDLDTSRITGKTYLPMFLSESFSSRSLSSSASRDACRHACRHARDLAACQPAPQAPPPGEGSMG